MDLQGIMEKSDVKQVPEQQKVNRAARAAGSWWNKSIISVNSF